MRYSEPHGCGLLPGAAISTATSRAWLRPFKIHGVLCALRWKFQFRKADDGDSLSIGDGANTLVIGINRARANDHSDCHDLPIIFQLSPCRLIGTPSRFAPPIERVPGHCRDFNGSSLVERFDPKDRKFRDFFNYQLRRSRFNSNENFAKGWGWDHKPLPGSLQRCNEMSDPILRAFDRLAGFVEGYTCAWMQEEHKKRGVNDDHSFDPPARS